MAKYAAKGSTLTVNAVVIPNFRGISPSGGEAERVDVTTHDSASGFREFVAGFKGESSFTFEILYDPNLAAHYGLAVLYGAGTVVPIIIGLNPTPASETITFNGYISNFPLPDLPIDGPMVITVGVQVAGAITFPVVP